MATGGGIFDPIEESVISVVERLKDLQSAFAAAAANAAKLGATADDTATKLNGMTSSAERASEAVVKLGSTSSATATQGGGNAISDAESMTSQINARTGRIPIT